MATEHEAWLELTVEEPLEPELPICDSHHHLWNRSGSCYLLEEFLQDIGGGHHITQTVFLQCRAMYRNEGPEELKPVGETESIQRIADQNVRGHYSKINVAAGIAAFADLTLGSAVTPVLEAHIAASPDRLRGIRHASAWDAYPGLVHPANPGKGLLLNPKFREGFAYLQKYRLSYDAWLYHLQLIEAVALARAFPETPIILDHVGGPLGIGPYADKRKEVFQEWKRGIAELATCPNVIIKLCGFDWHKRPKPPGSVELAEAMAPYFHWCIERFGVDRCMFESNFPVDRVSYSYTVMWNAFKRISKDFSEAERVALFHDNAARVYRLPIASKW